MHGINFEGWCCIVLVWDLWRLLGCMLCVGCGIVRGIGHVWLDVGAHCRA